MHSTNAAVPNLCTCSALQVCSGVVTSAAALPTVHTELAGSGIAVFGMDAHGHGRSEPSGEDDRALVHDFSHLVRSVSVPSTRTWHRLATTPAPQPSSCAHAHAHSKTCCCNVMGRCAQSEVKYTTCTALHPE